MIDSDKQATRNWYIRQSGQVHGPFTVGHVKREVLLGHIAAKDEISHDQRHWTHIDEHPELIPTVMKADMSDPLARDRLAAARRWADDGEHDHHTLSEQMNFDHDDEDHAPGSLITKKLEQRRHRQWQNRAFFLLLVVVISAGFFQYFSTATPVTEQPVDCSVIPVKGIDLSNCFLQNIDFAAMDISHAIIKNANLNNTALMNANLASADLSYSLLLQSDLESASLRNAILTGADFNRANLRNVDLSGADLSYANLLAADIRGANFNGAKLGNTRWVDGSICPRGAVSRCE